MSSETLLTPSIITNETLMILANNLVTASRVHRKFENKFVKIGSTLTIRKPNRFKTVKGPALQLQNINEPSTSITINQQAQTAWQFTSQELTLIIEEFRERYIKPAAESIANTVDFDVLTLFNQIFNETGSPGTVPNAFSYIADVGKRMDQGAVPQDGRTLVLGPDAYWEIVKSLPFNNFVKSVAEPAFKGFLGNLANFDIYLDQNVQAQVVGNYSGSGVVNGANQTGSLLVTNGWTASVTGLLNVGDVVTLAGVYSVNPQNRLSTGVLQNFVVTATVNSDSGGNATIGIAPAITTSGAYQTVSASPANMTPVVPKGSANTSYFQNIAFVKDTFGLVNVPLEEYNGTDFMAQENYKGINLRIWRQADIFNDVAPCRLDSLYGVAAYYPETGVRMTN